MTDQAQPESKKTDASIQQLNIGYNPEQDRLLLRVGLSDDSELVVWLTYRIARQLWQLFNKDANLPTAGSINPDAVPASAVEQFGKEVQAAQALKNMDFATEYQPRKQKLADEILLVKALKLTGGESRQLEMICVNGVSVKVNMGSPLILALCNMLQMAAKQASWDIGAPINVVATAVATQETKILH